MSRFRCIWKAVWQADRGDSPFFLAMSLGMAANAARWIEGDTWSYFVAAAGGFFTVCVGLTWAIGWVTPSGASGLLKAKETLDQDVAEMKETLRKRILESRPLSGFAVGAVVAAPFAALFAIGMGIREPVSAPDSAAGWGACAAFVLLVLIDLPARVKEVQAAVRSCRETPTLGPDVVEPLLADPTGR